MTPVWHHGALAGLVLPAELVVWHVNRDDRVTPARPSADDLADAAQAADGAGRLWRRGLARALIAHLAGCHPDAVGFDRGAAGAPLVTTPTGWHISLSGRGADAVIAAGRVALGVDGEPLDAATLLPDMLSPEETDHIASLAIGDRPAQWLRRWTAKEAVAKLIGEPRHIAPHSIETRLLNVTTMFARCGDFHARCWTRETGTMVITLAVAA